MRTLISLLYLLIFFSNSFSQESVKLYGQLIGTSKSVDYSTNLPSTNVNTIKNVFDGDLNTYFASYDRSNTWAGLDLGTQYVITSVKYSPRNDGNGPQRLVLGIFEGANREDFMDAVPLTIIKSPVSIGQWGQNNISVSKGFRYVRYIGPNNARCNIAEIEFYGYEGAGDESRFYTPTMLPLVNIHVENAAEPQDKETDLVADIQIISDNGVTRIQQPGTTRLRGNASMDFPKKPYRIKFDKKQNVLDAPAKAKKWTLISNYGDKSLIRNLVAFEISRRVGLTYTPYGRLVDVIFNGEYKGTYQLCDQVEVNPGRIEVESMDNTMVDGDDLTGGYLIEIDAYAEGEDNYFYSNRWNPVTIKYPDSDEIVAEQTNYIKSHYNLMEATLFSSQYSDPISGYRKYLDLDSFLRHFIVGELSGNTDTYWSTYMYKKRGDDKFYTGPVWDFDIAFENDYRTYPINDKIDYIYRSGGSAAGQMIEFVNRIIVQDGEARQQLQDLWGVLRYTGAISAESINAYIDGLVTEINASQKLNFTRWNILNTTVHMNPWQTVYSTYSGNVNVLRNYISARIEWMDKKLNYDPAGIENITYEDADSSLYKVYNIAGNLLRVSQGIEDLQKGIYVIKYKGETKTVVIK